MNERVELSWGSWCPQTINCHNIYVENMKILGLEKTFQQNFNSFGNWCYVRVERFEVYYGGLFNDLLYQRISYGQDENWNCFASKQMNWQSQLKVSILVCFLLNNCNINNNYRFPWIYIFCWNKKSKQSNPWREVEADYATKDKGPNVGAFEFVSTNPWIYNESTE